MRVIINSILIILFLTGISKSQTGWVQQYSNTDKILEDVFFVNEYTGWVVTDSSKILKTTDGGLTWSMQTLPNYTPLETVFFINENTGWAAGGYYFFLNSGYIFKTTNGGINWTSNQTAHIRSLYFINENTGFAGVNNSLDFGSGGSIFKTTNGGLLWTSDFYTYEFLNITFKNSDTGYALGHYWDDTSNDSSFIFRTTNTGESWEIKYKIRNEPSYIQTFKDMSVSGNNVWVTGKDSVILHSSDNGENWDNQIATTKGNKYSISFADDNTGWVVGTRYPDTTNIMKTTNGGVNWFNLKNTSGNLLKSVMFVNAYTGWAVGYNGTILKTTTGGLTFINYNTSQISSGYQLYQNYPNPFNPSTNLKYEIPKPGFVSLKVYDVSGKEITTLVNENKSSGKYDITFFAETGGKNLSSGIYFYSLFVNNEKVETRKMVLIR